jgi:hypothetical protein
VHPSPSPYEKTACSIITMEWHTAEQPSTMPPGICFLPPPPLQERGNEFPTEILMLFEYVKSALKYLYVKIAFSLCYHFESILCSCMCKLSCVLTYEWRMYDRRTNVWKEIYDCKPYCKTFRLVLLIKRWTNEWEMRQVNLRLQNTLLCSALSLLNFS